MVIDELITILGFDVKDKEKLDQYQNSIGNVVDKIQNMAMVGTAAMGAVLVGITAINSETAKLANLAETVGLNYELVDGLGGAIKAIGLDYEHVTDLAEEMSNKIGESKSIYQDWLKGDKLEGKELKLVGGMEDAFKGLDFSIVDEKFKGLKLEEKFKMFSGMDATKQFELVMDTATTMKDTQKAVAMADILMGGEANKIIGYLRTQGTTLSELLAKKREMNFLDEEGIDGAKKYAKEMANTSSIFGSIVKQLSGLAGEYLSPILKSMNDWFRLNKKIVQIKLKEYVENIFYVFERLGNVFKVIWSGVEAVANALGGWDVVLPILGLILAFFNPWKALIIGLMLVVDDLFSYFSGGKSVVGDFINYFKTEFPLLYSIVESLIGVFKSVFGYFVALYDNVIKPIFTMIITTVSETGDSILSDFKGVFDGMGVVVKSFFEIVSNIFKMLTAFISGDFEAVKQYASSLFDWLLNGFDGVVMTLTNGAATFRSVWADAIEWIMSKIEWVTNKIDAVKSAAGNIGDDISDGISSVWDGAVNLFGGDEESKPMVMSMAPITAPSPAMPKASNNNTSNVANTHHSSYNINVSSKGGSPEETAEIIKSKIIDTKSLQKTMINKVKPIHGAT